MILGEVRKKAFWKGGADFAPGPYAVTFLLPVAASLSKVAQSPEKAESGGGGGGGDSDTFFFLLKIFGSIFPTRGLKCYQCK